VKIAMPSTTASVIGSGDRKLAGYQVKYNACGGATGELPQIESN